MIKMKDTAYKKTVAACFIGFVSQAIAVNFPPLLFLTFHNTYNIPLEKITFLVIVNFITQLITDLVASKYAKKIGYRTCLVLCHTLCGAGLVLMAFLPDAFNPFTALIVATCIYAVGSGLLEVLLNPVIEACPTKNKAGIMSIMHSFYCWGVVVVVLISTAFFASMGIGCWKTVTCIWSLIPFANAVFFTHVPIYPIAEETNDMANYKELFSQKKFVIIMCIMVCAGASELTVGQWASTFVEDGLKLDKSMGDLIGVCGFALCMGIARSIYGKYSERMSLRGTLIASAILCVISYLLIGLSPYPWFGLLGCILCGLSVGMFWPGTISMASERIKSGGTTMYALCALGGDMGCTTGPALAGFMMGVLGDNLRLGILCSIIFPILMILGLVLLGKKNK